MTNPRFTTWQYMARIVAWRKAHFWLNVLLWGLFHVVPLSFGLFTKAILDTLSGGAAAGLNAWTLLVLYGLTMASRVGIFTLGFHSWTRLLCA
jgi:ATP-binding cassette subfamily B protein